jgi:hypothetical protein
LGPSEGMLFQRDAWVSRLEFVKAVTGFWDPGRLQRWWGGDRQRGCLRLKLLRRLSLCWSDPLHPKQSVEFRQAGRNEGGGVNAVLGFRVSNAIATVCGSPRTTRVNDGLAAGQAHCPENRLVNTPGNTTVPAQQQRTRKQGIRNPLCWPPIAPRTHLPLPWPSIAPRTQIPWPSIAPRTPSVTCVAGKNSVTCVGRSGAPGARSRSALKICS